MPMSSMVWAVSNPHNMVWTFSVITMVGAGSVVLTVTESDFSNPLHDTCMVYVP